MKDFNILFKDYDFYYDYTMKSGMQSIPLGNGEMGGNVWINESGIINILLSRTDAWSEVHRLLKVGLTELEISPNPFINEVHSHFSLYDATLHITAPGITVRIYADANAPAIRLFVQSDNPITVQLRGNNYRNQSFDFRSDFSNFHMLNAPVSCSESADVTFVESGMFGQYHYNETSCFDYTLELQNLEECKKNMRDPLLHRIFGFGAWGSDKTEDVNEYSASIYTATLESSTPAEWKSQLFNLAAQYGTEKAETFDAHKEYWHKKWSSSYVICPKESDGYLLAKGFLYQRYMSLCAGKGTYPIKFNGSIFTAGEMDGHPGNYDSRRWGGPYWIQNTRLIYWAMLESGDYDMMKPFFKMYLNVMPICKERVRKHYGHRGMLIPETITIFGTYANKHFCHIEDDGSRKSWGKKSYKPSDIPNPFIRWHYNGMVEIAYLMLRYVEKSGDRTQLKEFLSFAEEVLLFFRDHFEVLDEKLLLTPISSLETWQYCVNDTPDIAGIMALIAAIQACGAANEELLYLCKEMSLLLPQLPMDVVDGKNVIAPCEQKIDKKTRNEENPELYTIFPYYLYGIGKPDLQLAIDTYHARIFHSCKGWSQDPVQAALLGLTEEAVQQLKKSIPMVDERCIFPAFWGPNYDETPDQDHGNNILLCVAAMLYQEGRILPAWPKDWDVMFRLPDGKGDFITISYRNGELK